jgi:hypothetical protein
VECVRKLQTSVTVADNAVDIWTGCLTNTDLQHYRYTNRPVAFKRVRHWTRLCTSICGWLVRGPCVLRVLHRIHATCFLTACNTIITITCSLHALFWLMISVWQYSLCPKCTELKKCSIACNYRHLLHSSQTRWKVVVTYCQSTSTSSSSSSSSAFQG